MEYQALAQARQVYWRAVPELMPRKNVIACGIGHKIRGEEQTDELSLMVSVVRKEPEAQLSEHDVVPKRVDGLSTDVIETGCIRALASDDPKARHRPAPPGVSIGHEAITAGTFGLVVHRDGERFILSNNHVLANSNEAEIGDAIRQPGPVDGGTSADQIATLVEFMPLDFGQAPGECDVARFATDVLNALAKLTQSRHRLRAVQQTDGVNLMDAALASPLDPALIVPEILRLGLPTGVADAVLGQPVQKMGRTTGLTEGVVQQIDVTVNVDYNGRQVQFIDQVLTSSMSQPGDSGSAILDMEKRVVGLLFAGSERVTIFTPIQRILSQFGVDVVQVGAL
jgi:S1-C subfamily serine protease